MTNIRVGFGRRATGAWDRPVALEWSSDGSTWELINDDVSTVNEPFIWESTYFDLPSSAENVANLRFRFSYSTTTNANCDVGVPNFRIDDFTVGSNFSLPVELTRFEAKLIDRQVQLDWATATEVDNDYFAVEHSADGKNFATIGQVAGAGTTQVAQQYRFWHRHPVAGTNYYRLRQVDRNGLTSYSALRSVAVTGRAVYRVFPMPATDRLRVEWQQASEHEVHWTVYNALGRLVGLGQTPAPATTLTIPIDHLPQGKYLLQILQDHALSAHQFIKL